MTLSPGRTIGILGGGQLGRMLALEARRMGYLTVVFDSEPGAPAAAAADLFRPLPEAGDEDAVKAAARACGVMTLETEHIPLPLLRAMEAHVPLAPGADVLAVARDRLLQKRTLAGLGIPLAPFAEVSEAADLPHALAAVGVPAVLKTRLGGYDGRGQVRVDGPEALALAWEQLGRGPCVLEAFVVFERELSVIAARGQNGELRFFPVAENEHRRHILHTTRVPARLGSDKVVEAERLAAAIAAGLGHVGVLAVELFQRADGTLLVNEIAPRVHNSGHYTWGGCATSQFEQHLRAICGLPLGDTALVKPAVMLNLLGDLWREGPPDWRRVLEHPRASLHLYGKREARPGRKMGHVLFLDEDAERAQRRADEVFGELDRAPVA